jgi:hypothetical protein
MKNYRTLLVCLPLFSLPFLLSNLTVEKAEAIKRFHTEQEMALFATMVMDTLLPISYNAIFAGSGVCQKCHGFDTLGVASVDASGNDVNVVDDWRATMMGNSARDPFWRAKVSHEVLLHPQFKNEIEDKCTSCHAPMGHFNAKHIGATHYLMADLLSDEIAQDGVSCLGCHMQNQESLGLHFSGELKFDTFKVAYGPYPAPLVSPMLTETGYKPKHSLRSGEGAQCAGCHTLITETIDLQGNITGNKFVEQATYHEWLNSVFNDSVSCQGCHMPSLDKFPVYIVTGAQTEPRNPFYLHEFVGGNVTMLKLLRDNVESLGLKASPAQFDDVIAKTVNLLQNRTLDLNLKLENWESDTVRFSVKLTNKAGHKFPSGYPSRRAFIEFLVKNENGDTLFISGKTDQDFEVYGQNPTYEPHYQIITSENQVQIYELVMGDVNGNVTTVLERAGHPIKDNRLPPAGFTKNHPAYDTTKIAGAALSDTDFNHENGTEGSGSDVVFYYVPMDISEPVYVSARVFYQSTPPKWMQEMFAESTPEIDAFRTMFDTADRTPVLIREASDFFSPPVTAKERPSGHFIRLYPTPSADGRIFVQSTVPHDVKIFGLNGQLVDVLKRKSGNYELRLPGSGVFLLKFEGKNGRVQMEKVVMR